MLPALLDSFAADLELDYAGTLQHFLALQVRGSENANAILRQLRARLQEGGLPQPEGLRAGLQILHDTDLRAQLPGLQLPVQLLNGARDTLVPAAAMEQTAYLLPQARCTVIEGAGHAPFIAAPDQVALVLKSLLRPATTVSGEHDDG
jgi:pimeloyl-[acyl-carrier protein] methyl ester esterase